MHWGLRHRNARAIGFAVVLLAFLGFMFLTHEDDRVVERARVEGTLVEINSFGDNPILNVELPDGRTARVTPTTGLRPSKIGAKVPLIILRYESGREHALFDEQAWIDR